MEKENLIYNGNTKTNTTVIDKDGSVISEQEEIVVDWITPDKSNNDSDNIGKEILTFWVEHKDKRHYHNFHWNMIWVILKYKLVWGCKISFTVTKHVDSEKYTCSFYAE